MAEPSGHRPTASRVRVIAFIIVTATLAIVAWWWFGPATNGAAAATALAMTAPPPSPPDVAESATTVATAPETNATRNAPLAVQTRIDCASADASNQVVHFITQQLGPSLTRLETTGVGQWSDNDRADIEPSGDSTDDGVKSNGSHSSYSDAILQELAQNGDPMSAAVYGARLLNRIERIDHKDSDHAQRERQLAESQRYLLQGIRGNVSGSFAFLQQVLQQRLDDFRRDAAYGKRSDTEVRAVEIEQHAWLYVQLRHGRFNERVQAYHRLQAKRLFKAFLPDLNDQAQTRAQQLEQQLDHATPLLTPAEQTAELAAREFIDTFVDTEPQLDRLRCRDGHLVSFEIKRQALLQLVDRYPI